MGVVLNESPLMRSRPGQWLAVRVAPVIATVATLVLGMLYVIDWAGVAHGDFTRWMTPSDIWGTYLNSMALVLHGQLTAAYAAYPGALLLFAPVAAVGHALHLEVGPEFAAFTAPTGWVLVGPFELLVSMVPIFAVDTMGRRWGLSTPRRIGLALVGAFVLANVTIKGGHPEDAVAVGLALFAAIAAADGKWKRCGWLLGVAVVIQPLAVLALPALATVVVVVAGWRRFVDFALRAVLPAVVVLGPALIADWGQLSYWLRHQPNFPTYNHFTPWTSFAGQVAVKVPTFSPFTGKVLFYQYSHVLGVNEGPSRLVAIAAVVLVSVLWCRVRHRLADIVFVLGLAFFLRVLFESVLDSYYVWPVLAICLALAARRSARLLAVTSVVAVFATWLSNEQWSGMWPWWTAMMLTLAVLVVLSWLGYTAPSAATRGPEGPPPPGGLGESPKPRPPEGPALREEDVAVEAPGVAVS
ncbi:MAG TPA: hypothetical protein VK277_00500 [Acidimicrobiales bacterium]|nr:hypothetical protein [Acidimicrobiales bacterium]